MAVAVRLGASSFHWATSFGMIRGGKVDAAILGAMHVLPGGILHEHVAEPVTVPRAGRQSLRVAAPTATQETNGVRWPTASPGWTRARPARALHGHPGHTSAEVAQPGANGDPHERQEPTEGNAPLLIRDQDLDRPRVLA